MAFKDSFHEVSPGQRVNGNAVVFVIKSTKQGGPGSGAKTLDIGCFGISSFSLIEVEDIEKWPIPQDYIPVLDIDATYAALELAGLSTVVENVLVNPANVALLQYSDDHISAESVGGESRFNFDRSNRGSWERTGNNFLVPDAEFDTFKALALQRLTTALEVVGQFSNSFIRFDGSNDYVEFTTKGAGNADLLDWTKDWTIGVTLTEFDIASDGKFITLFSSGDNAIMLRRGGSNHGLYLTGNDGANKAGINAWYAPNAGGKLLFANDGSAGFLKYYIGNVDGTFALRGVVNIASATLGNNNPGTNFCVGKKVGSNAVAESLNFHGGMNNLITADEAFANASPMIAEYFGVNETYDESSFYADLTSWVKMGEDIFPAVTDEKGVLTGGELINGNEEDFVEIPNEPGAILEVNWNYQTADNGVRGIVCPEPSVLFPINGVFDVTGGAFGTGATVRVTDIKRTYFDGDYVYYIPAGDIYLIKRGSAFEAGDMLNVLDTDGGNAISPVGTAASVAPA